MRKTTSGFTIVELLIVIVIIGILAAITIVAYNGIQQRAKTSTVMADLANSAKKMSLDNVNNGSYAATASAVDSGKGLPTSAGTTYAYHSTGSTYCITGTNGTVSYKISDTAQTPSPGGCAGDGVGGVSAVTNMITNPSFEVDTSGWGSANGATLASSTDFAFSGTRSVKVIPSATAYSGIAFSTPGTNGTSYTYSAYVYSVSSQTINFAADNFGMNTAVTVGPSWQRITLSGSQTSNQPIYVRAVNANGPTFYVDSVMFTQGSTIYNYADGASPNWIWNGSANSSTSTGPPQ